jgi:uncharacterized membrane protein YccC
MPQDDVYYHGVAYLVVADYCFIILAFSMEAMSELFAVLICLLVLIAVLCAIKMPQLIIRERERSQMIMYQQKSMQAYVASYRQNEDKLRTLRHDIKHIITAMNKLIDQNKYEYVTGQTNNISAD